MTSTITERELTLIREEQEKFMDIPVIIKRDELTDPTEAPAPSTVAENVPCSIKAGFSFFRDVADKIQTVNPHTLTFPWNQSLKQDDKVITPSGDTFIIRDVRDADSYVTALKVLADRIP